MERRRLSSTSGQLTAQESPPPLNDQSLDAGILESRPRAGTLSMPRQTVFGAMGPNAMCHHIETQTTPNDNATIEEVRVERPNHIHPYLQARLHPKIIRVLAAIDSAFICYAFSALILLAAGVGSIFLLTEEHKSNDNHEHRPDKAHNTAQLWIVGPIFICSAILVGIKAFTHINKRMHPLRFRFVNGQMLEADNRPSMAAIPPTYSQAQNAPVPPEVYDLDADSKCGIEPLPDTESLARVTLNFDPQPPTYDEVANTQQHTRTTNVHTDESNEQS